MVVGATSNHHEWTPADQKEGSLDGAGVALDWGSTRAREAPEPTVPTVTAGYFVQYRVPPVWGPDACLPIVDVPVHIVMGMPMTVGMGMRVAITMGTKNT